MTVGTTAWQTPLLGDGELALESALAQTAVTGKVMSLANCSHIGLVYGGGLIVNTLSAAIMKCP